MQTIWRLTYSFVEPHLEQIIYEGSQARLYRITTFDKVTVKWQTAEAATESTEPLDGGASIDVQGVRISVSANLDGNKPSAYGTYELLSPVEDALPKEA
jgi:hypothetical protein